MPLLPAETNLRALWMQYQGLAFSIAVRVMFGVSPRTVHRVLTGARVRVDAWTSRRITDALERAIRLGGREEEVLRTYLLFLDQSSWVRVAGLLGVKVSTVKNAITGISQSPGILAALEKEIQLKRSVASHDDPHKQNLIARPRMYRGLYTRVARQLGVSVSFVSQVAAGKRKSPRVELALGRRRSTY